MFKRMLSAFGVGAPTVDTVLSNPNTRPGLGLDGVVHLAGGDHQARIEHITVALVAHVEVEGGDLEHRALTEFHRERVSGPFQLSPGQQQAIPFQVPVPWETPITEGPGRRLPGAAIGLRTEVAIARAVDQGDLDPVQVHPLPVQERILEAFEQLGFVLKSTDLEYGRILGVPQTLPFYQEIEFYPSPRYSGALNEIELTFVAGPDAVDVVLEFDKRGGLFTAGQDTFGRYRVGHSDAEHTDWAGQVAGWVEQSLGHWQALMSGHEAHGYPGAHGAKGHHGHYSSHGHHGSHGPGVGGVVAGAMLGFAGGLLAGEVAEEIFDDDGGDFGD